ncbi:hypothetical protein BGZ95_011876 [Linnemannia exigua]|uniref:FAD-binding domain-containing protein n=1 Tax=Linnemannia exigua TaxID=604196 RepID=A0AAD4H5B7_9FUNG|nr:hypothetical protein BGZ95_011876 [Linnemannia exigua]
MSAGDKPTLIIVGAGLGGLMLGALLEKAGIPYTIFERAHVVKPLGSAMAVGPAILPIFQQLGIYDEILAISKPFYHVYNYLEATQGLRTVKPTHFGLVEELSQHTKSSSRVLDITEKDDKITVHLADNVTFEADIVVGADGAYSAVRQRMFDSLKQKGVLPKADQKDLPFDAICLMGQTKVLDPKAFPVITLPYGHFTQIVGKGRPYSWHTFATAQNTICYMVMQHLPKTMSKAAIEERARDSKNSEWTFHPIEAMMEETRHFPIPLGDGKEGILGDLFDLTSKEFMSKVMLEDKVFETWYNGRSVLLGDGAVTAMHDAVALANLLYSMPTKTPEDITRLFQEYRKERYPAVMESYNTSKQLAKTALGGIIGTIYFYFVVYMPFFLWRYVVR